MQGRSGASLVGEVAPPDADVRVPLRFLTCGSVDDGKSTLIGRLLYEEKVVYDDHLAALERDSKKHGTTGTVDYALLLDGLEVEREQGITIDVAYRHFATKRRTFLIADAPGHEQYTRNMATGASNADLAVLLVDAQKGLLVQTRRHAIIASILGLRHVVLAVNKMDLVKFDQFAFRQIAEEFVSFAGNLGFLTIKAIPVSAREGDNLSSRSTRMHWYDGPTLLSYLEEIDVDDKRVLGPFRMPVQLVCRPNQEFRGFSGTVVGGQVQVGDELTMLPSGRIGRVKQIYGPGGEYHVAIVGDAITVTMVDEIDIGRGDMFAGPQIPHVADQFAAHLCGCPEKSYFLADPI